MHEGTRYIRLPSAAQILGLEPEMSEDGESCAFPWRKSRVELQAESDELRYLDESVRLEAPVLLCRGGEEMLLPVESFCEAIQIGLLYDEEFDHLYCTPAAGNWELPQGYYVPVMMYHGVGWGSKDANLFVNPQDLEEQIVYMLDNGYTPIWFSDLEHVEDYEKPVLLTYDDGWKNTYFNLLPLLEKYHVKVTIFMVWDFFTISGNHLDEDEALEMAASGYVDFQSHTMSHQNLTTIPCWSTVSSPRNGRPGDYYVSWLGIRLPAQSGEGKARAPAARACPTEGERRRNRPPAPDPEPPACPGGTGA